MLDKDENITETWLVFDTTNMLFRAFHHAESESVDVVSGLAVHTALTTLNKYYKKIKPTRVITAFDRSSWRKEYTAQPDRITKLKYKGNRRQGMTPAQQAKFEAFMEHCKAFEDMIRTHTTITAIAQDRLEADDLIAAICRYHNAPHRRIVIISTDSDLWQLTQYQNVLVMSPATDKIQTLDEFNGDPQYYLFTKCVRGDSTDNIMSAYPRVRQTRILSAYQDTYERLQLMESTWKLGDVDVKVGDIFNENQVLISLSHQPPDIADLMQTAVQTALSAPKNKFSLREFIRYVGSLQLKRIVQGVNDYVGLLGRS